MCREIVVFSNAAKAISADPSAFNQKLTFSEHCPNRCVFTHLQENYDLHSDVVCENGKEKELLFTRLSQAIGFLRRYTTNAFQAPHVFLDVPQVIILLQIQPQLRCGSKCDGETSGHFRSDSTVFVYELRNGRTRHA
jgi:hypothetical protein